MSKPINLAHPRYWLSWIGVGLLRTLAFLPFPVLWAMGWLLGSLIAWLMPARIHITCVNLALCFPELSTKDHKKLAWQHFRLLGSSILTISAIWWARPARLQRLVTLKDTHFIDQAKAKNQNILILAPHFVTMDAGGIRLSMEQNLSSMYLPHKNTIFEVVSFAQRTRFNLQLFNRRAPLTKLIRQIRQGQIFYYLPDQNAGADHGIFAPFFGVSASTYPTLGKMAKISKATVIPCLNKLRWNGIQTQFFAPLENFPDGDPLKDTTQMNTAIERLIRLNIPDYLWSHKRFKRRPKGEQDVYL